VLSPRARQVDQDARPGFLERETHHGAVLGVPGAGSHGQHVRVREGRREAWCVRLEASREVKHRNPLRTAALRQALRVVEFGALDLKGNPPDVGDFAESAHQAGLLEGRLVIALAMHHQHLRHGTRAVLEVAIVRPEPRQQARLERERDRRLGERVDANEHAQEQQGKRHDPGQNAAARRRMRRLGSDAGCGSGSHSEKS
jgi:hypothetical protein